MGAARGVEVRVAELLRRAPIVDGHNDLPWRLRELGLGVDAVADRIPELHTDLPRLRAGGVGAQFWSVFVPGSLSGPEAVARVLEQIDTVDRLVRAHPSVLAPARSADDVRAAWASGRIASLVGAEGGRCLDGSLGVLRMLRALGVAYLTLTHNENVGWADSATDGPDAGGLGAFGRGVVAEMNRLGMIVDLSHTAPSTMHDALDVTSAPVLFTHSGCRAVCDHVRDVPDDVLGRLPDNGGVVMVTFVPAFVSQMCADHGAAWREERVRLGLPARGPLDGAAPEVRGELDAWLAAHPEPEATLAEVADHVDHAREAAGVDHIGLGGDYDGVDSLARGLEDVSCYPALLAELAERGWSDDDLARLTGANVLRVLDEVQAAARPDDEPGGGSPRRPDAPEGVPCV